MHASGWAGRLNFFRQRQEKKGARACAERTRDQKVRTKTTRASSASYPSPHLQLSLGDLGKARAAPDPSRAARVADHEVRGGELAPPKELVLLGRLFGEARRAGDRDIVQGVRGAMHQG